MSQDQKCRVCGCTEDDCSKCIKLTGHPCHWVEEDLCSACADAINKQQNIMSMSFFKQLVGFGNVDLTMRIMQKDNELTINIMPGSKSTQDPIIVTASPEELDEKFFSEIMPGVNEVKGLISNLEDVKKSLQNKQSQKADAAPSKAASKKAAPKKSAVKKAVKKSEKETAPPTEEPNLFENEE